MAGLRVICQCALYYLVNLDASPSQMTLFEFLKRHSGWPCR